MMRVAIGNVSIIDDIARFHFDKKDLNLKTGILNPGATGLRAQTSLKINADAHSCARCKNPTRTDTVLTEPLTYSIFIFQKNDPSPRPDRQP